MDTTAVKALRTLEWLCKRQTPTGVTEMSVLLGLTKSNSHRILTTLSSLGFARCLDDGRYEATLKTWELGNEVLSRLDVKTVAQKIMTELADKSLETVHLSILEGAEVIYIDKVEGKQPVRAYSRVGGRAPAYAVATGKALLAYQQDVEDFLPEEFEPFTRFTINNQADLCRELNFVRLKGYAINRGEWREGVCGIGAPIWNHEHEIVAAIGISGPSSRLSLEKLEELAPLVVGSASQVSTALGCRIQAHPEEGDVSDSARERFSQDTPSP